MVDETANFKDVSNKNFYINIYIYFKKINIILLFF